MDETLSLGLKYYFQLPSVTSHFYETNNEKKRNILSGVGLEPTPYSETRTPAPIVFWEGI